MSLATRCVICGDYRGDAGMAAVWAHRGAHFRELLKGVAVYVLLALAVTVICVAGMYLPLIWGGGR